MPTTPTLLLPASATWPLDPWRPDAQAAEQAGFTTHRFDEAALLRGDVGEVLRRLPRGDGPILLRSRELPADAYAALHAALAHRGWALPTSPEAFARVNHGPSSWSRLRFAPCVDVRFVVGFDADAAWAAFRALEGPTLVHDHASACLQPPDAMAFLPADADRAMLDAAVAEVRAARGDAAVGGLTLRRAVGVTAGDEAPTERLARVVSFRGAALYDDAPDGLPDLAVLHAALGAPWLALDVGFDELDRPLLVGVADAGGVEWPGDLDLVDVYRRLAAAPTG